MTLCRKSVLSGALGGLVGSVLMWTAVHYTETARDRIPQSADEFNDAATNRGIFIYKGQTVAAPQLSNELKTQFDRALATRNQQRRDADLQFYKDLDKIARLHVLEKHLATVSAAQGKSLRDAESELLSHEEASTEDARSLYESSDPSAPREGFAPVKNQLVGYLNEVRRREALESWTNGLRKKGDWQLLLSRPMPLPDLARVNLQGLPAEGKGQPNALVFVDYLCADCIPFLVEFAKQVGEQRGVLRPVYVPFPYTRPEVSMALARGSLCAQQLGSFSSFHMAALTKGDLLSEVSVFDLARQTDMKLSDFKACYRSGEGLAELLTRAQGLARQFGLMQTPALVFNGRLLEGDEIFKKLEPLLKNEAVGGQLTKRAADNKGRASSQP